MSKKETAIHKIRSLLNLNQVKSQFVPKIRLELELKANQFISLIKKSCIFLMEINSIWYSILDPAPLTAHDLF